MHILHIAFSDAKKVGKTYKFYLTRLGKAVIATALIIKEMSIILQLAMA